jgi:hypothetical protein
MAAAFGLKTLTQGSLQIIRVRLTTPTPIMTIVCMLQTVHGSA